jgi:hypothetical protein
MKVRLATEIQKRTRFQPDRSKDAGCTQYHAIASRVPGQDLEGSGLVTMQVKTAIKYGMKTCQLKTLRGLLTSEISLVGS